MYDLNEFRKEKDSFFGQGPNSPLSHELQHEFQGLNYFPENPNLRFEIEVEPFPEKEHVQMQTSTGDSNEYLRFGKFQFDVEGETAELTLFTTDDGETFLPFVDSTSPVESYGAGRYLELEHVKGKTYLVDFNLAYNPWCAYSPNYSCPFPPAENRINVPIKAGEKNFS